MTQPTSIPRRTALAGLGALGLTAGAGVTAASAAPKDAKKGNGPLIGKARRGELHVMSFNIRYDRSGTQPGQADYWGERKPLVTALVKAEQPTLLGVQEALFHQLSAIEAGLPRHRMIGYGREGGSAGEYSSIFYDADRLAVLEWGQFWLSDTPSVIASATWGNQVTRVVVWARMVDRTTNTEFLAINTHFDHESENARVKSAQAILALAAKHPKLPVVVTGDFNSTAKDSGAWRSMVASGPLVDTWEAAGRRLTPAYGTFPNYRDAQVGGNRIDWVLVSPTVKVLEAAINIQRFSGRYPSDHTPVQAVIRFA